MANQPRKSLSRVQEFKLGDLIRSHCKRIEDYAVYDEGWSDERIQQEMGYLKIDCSMNSVMNIRRELVGDLRQARVNSAKAKIEDLEKRIVELEKKMASLMLDSRISSILKGSTMLTQPVHPQGRPPSRPPNT